MAPQGSGPRPEHQSSLELAWLVSLFPQPQLGTCWPLSPSHRWWLTGTLPEDRAAHELEEALGVEAGPVDRDSVLGKWSKDEVTDRAHMHPLLACLLTHGHYVAKADCPQTQDSPALAS